MTAGDASPAPGAPMGRKAAGGGLPPSSWLRRTVPVLVGFAAFLALWQVLRTLEVWEPVLFRGPLEVAVTLVGLARDGHLSRALATTLQRLALGYGLGLVLGMALSVLFLGMPAVKRSLSPLLIGLQGLPGVAWAPLALVWFGYSENAILFVTVMGCLFAVAMGFSDAFANVPPIYDRAARNMGASGIRLLTRVRIPSATPSLIGSAKIAWSFAWRSLLSAEIILPSLGGVGFLLDGGRQVHDVSQIMASMVIAIAVGIAFERLVFAQLEMRVRRRWGLAT